jgi:hypothetical protein
MDIAELENFLVNSERDLEWSIDNIENMLEEEFKKKNYLYIKSKHWDTCIRLNLDKLDEWNEMLIQKELIQGRNVVKMTRVTGFFSNIDQWNPGKRGELKDRFRVSNLFK